MSDQKKTKERRAYQNQTQGAKRQDQRKGKKKKKKKKRGFVWYALWTIFLLMLLGFLGVAGLIGPRLARYYSEAKATVDASTEETFHLNEASYLYDSEGNVLAKLHSGGDSVYLKYDQIPSDVVNAFVAIEDNSFWTNKGFDLKGIIRVGVDFLLSKGQTKHGASTITQQLTRNVFLSQEVSLERKAKELMYSYLLTKKYSKQQIMEFYVNDIYFANGFYGIEAAAKGYFNTKTENLSLSQIAYLCAIPNRPNYYDPFGDKDNALKRRNKILKDMKKRGDISLDAYKDAVLEEIEVVKTSIEQKNYEVTFGMHCAVLELMKQSGFEFVYHFDSNEAYKDYLESYNDTYEEMKGKLYTGGYQIYTSIDPKQQEILQRAVDANLIFDLEVSEEGIFAFQGAATVIDNSNGKVTAIVGGRSQSEISSFSLNRAYQSFRQPGSTMKPIAVYTPALQAGYKPDSALKEIDVSEAKELKDEDGIKVGDMTGPEYSLREAVEQSKNGCAYQLFNNIGIDYGISFLEHMQFAKIVKKDHNLSASLGGLTYGTTTLEMASAYATLANRGVYRGASCILSMKNSDQEELCSEVSEEIYEEAAAEAMVDVLTGVMTRGTGRALDWESDIEAMGKTGTTNDSKDGWFCGATPYYTIAVWCGYDQPKTLDSLYGGSYPGHIWKQAMEELTQGMEAVEFQRLFDDYDDYYDSHEDDGDKESAQDKEAMEKVQGIAGQIGSLDPADPNYLSQVQALYNEGLGLANGISDTEAKKEAISVLEAAYSAAMSKKDNADEESKAESSKAEEESTEKPSQSKPEESGEKEPETTKPAEETQKPEDPNPPSVEEPEDSGNDPVEDEPVEEKEGGGEAEAAAMEAQNLVE